MRLSAPAADSSKRSSCHLSRMVLSWPRGELARASDMWETGSVTTRAARNGADWALHGEKFAVEAADVANVFLVVARTEEGLGQFLIPRDSPGLSVMEMPQYDLGRVFGNVTLENVLVPAEKMVGEPGISDESINHQFLPRTNDPGCRDSQRTVGEYLTAQSKSYMQDRYTFSRSHGISLLPGAQAPDRRS